MDKQSGWFIFTLLLGALFFIPPATCNAAESDSYNGLNQRLNETLSRLRAKHEKRVLEASKHHFVLPSQKSPEIPPAFSPSTPESPDNPRTHPPSMAFRGYTPHRGDNPEKLTSSVTSHGKNSSREIPDHSTGSSLSLSEKSPFSRVLLKFQSKRDVRKKEAARLHVTLPSTSGDLGKTSPSLAKMNQALQDILQRPCFAGASNQIPG